MKNPNPGGEKTQVSILFKISYSRRETRTLGGGGINWTKQGWHDTDKNLYITQARFGDNSTKTWISLQGLKSNPPNMNRPSLPTPYKKTKNKKTGQCVVTCLTGLHNQVISDFITTSENHLIKKGKVSWIFKHQSVST